ncbi:arylesterase [Salinimicrobium marinum]|uniref:arylesterase n=1 Tax=Salinimicrobium marinum TaxID=680283 RepID=UPI0016770B56|nr:arylesterase [Salinimicrobium marinum]
MRNLLLCFALLFSGFLTSCGDNTGNKEEEKTEEIVNSENDLQEKESSETETGVILFFGNSLTAGLGVESEEAFPALIQEKLDSLRLDFEVVNAGLSGETTAGGRNRIDWVLNQDVEVFVLELGANDGLRGVPVEETKRNLQAIINTVREKNPDTQIILAGMQMPPNMGKDYTSRFSNIFPELAEENEVHLIPFLLENVGGIAELNQNDGIHPTAEGQKILAENVWDVLEPIVEEKMVVEE